MPCVPVNSPINGPHLSRATLHAKAALTGRVPLFAIEREINGKPPDERRRVRQERSRPRVEALGTWLREQYDELSPASLVAKAIAYSLNCWDGLVRFLASSTMAACA